MNILSKFLLAGALCSACALPAAADVVRITSCPDAQVFDFSPNGVWACGMIGDGQSDTYAFRWNVLTNDLQVSPVASYIGSSVSDDGVICGGFAYTDMYGKKRTVPGYYDGKWHRLSIPGLDDKIIDALDGSITPDGRTMVITVEGISDHGLDAAVWKDGVFQYCLSTGPGNMARAYDVSRDGRYFGGWINTENRQAALWDGNSEPQLLGRYWFVTELNKFSPDSKHYLYSIPWEEDARRAELGIYDMTNNQRNPINVGDYTDVNMFDLSANLTAIGAVNKGAGPALAIGGELVMLSDYMKEHYNIDFAEMPEIKKLTETDEPALTYGYAISDDATMYAVGYIDTEGDMRTMVIRTAANFNYPRPIATGAEQISSLTAVRVTWAMPYGFDTTGISGYNVYRVNADGTSTKLNDTPVSGFEYFDADATVGVNTYAIGAVYNDAYGESQPSAPVSIEVKEVQANAPNNFYGRQRGFNGMILNWNEPTTNLCAKQYYDEESATVGSGATQLDLGMEIGTRFSAAELALYKDPKITAAYFYPMSLQKGYTLAFYTMNPDGTTTLLQTQAVNSDDLKLGAKNVIKLDTPIDIPEQDLVMAVSTTVIDEANKVNVFGMDNTVCRAGYTDLLRRVEIRQNQISPLEEFDSMNKMGQALGMTVLTTWKAGIVLTPADAPADIDDVKAYEISIDGQSVASTEDLKITLPSVAEGKHNVGIHAAYTDGRVSPVKNIEIEVANDYDNAPAVDINELAVDYTGADAATGYTTSWLAPKDYDAQALSNNNGIRSTVEVQAPAENNYNLTAGVMYSPSYLRTKGGYTINSVSFFPTCDATFTIQISKDGVQILEQDVDDVVLNKWNTVALNSPITIDENATYLIAVDCYDVEQSGSPLAVDKQLHSGHGVDMIDYGSGWENLEYVLGTQTPSHWLINANITAPDFVRVEAGQKYVVMMDGASTGSGMLDEARYVSATCPEGTHTLSVNTLYTKADGSRAAAKSEAKEFNFSALAVQGLTADAVGNLPIVNGEIAAPAGYDCVTLYAADGAVLATGRTVSVKGLSLGTYLVRACGNAVPALVRTILVK